VKKAPGYKDIPIGGLIIEAGNAEKYETGSWRSFRPVRDDEKCIHCLICWIFCPDSAIIVEDGKVVGVDLDHCKRLRNLRPRVPRRKVQAITMVKESEFRE